MKNKILFLLLILVPVGLLIWFAYLAQINEQLASQQQYQNLAYTQLKRVDDKIVGYFQRLENTLLLERKNLEQGDLNHLDYVQKIRKILKYSPYILNIYIADSTENDLPDNKQKLIYPDLTQAISTKEKKFLVDIQMIVSNQSLFENKDNEQTLMTDLQSQPVSKSFRAIGRKVSESQSYIQQQDVFSEIKSGWITWYQERNLHHLFWFKDAEQRLFVLSLDRIRILSELINLLPGSSDNFSQKQFLFHDVTVQLNNANDELVYEWGNYSLSDEISIDLMLSYPVSSWKLSWYAKELSQPGFGQRWSMLIIALLASLLIIIILFLIYREYQRNIRLAQQRVNFVSQVSHELKTPLTNIQMYTELLENKVDLLDDPEELTPTKNKAHHFLSVIHNESLRLSRLIENVLSFSKVQKQSFQINLTMNRVDDCIDTVLVSFKPVFEQKNIQVQFARGGGEALLFDAQLLEQILNNLLSNVDKYASEGRRIDITSQQVNNDIQIKLRDYGPGIEKNEQEKIFTPFYRSSSKLTEGVSGTGIGLTISRQLALLHGGQLLYESVSDGACFVVCLKAGKQ
ncbi:MAG: HAMP domain-containing histidine kinase [Gammaproteobacteria bacterium]|nr:HAMP domain-containing histidine kinase [Gammaproteobacteria bacterium]